MTIFIYEAQLQVIDEARLDIKAGVFWRRGQNAFFDVRITHVNSESNKILPVEEIFRRNEAEKKRTYLERIVELEHATFTGKDLRFPIYV